MVPKLRDALLRLNNITADLFTLVTDILHWPHPLPVLASHTTFRYETISRGKQILSFIMHFLIMEETFPRSSMVYLSWLFIGENWATCPFLSHHWQGKWVTVLNQTYYLCWKICLRVNQWLLIDKSIVTVCKCHNALLNTEAKWISLLVNENTFIIK